MKPALLLSLTIILFAACNKNSDNPNATTCRLNASQYYFQQGGASLQLPNAFTPNSDGINDYYRPIGVSGLGNTHFDLAVFDHDGSILFETNDPYGNGWDGRHNGATVATGNYTVQLHFSTLNGDVVDRQECLAVLNYTAAGCAPRSNSGGNYYFEDMLDPNQPTHYYGTREVICP